MLLWTMLAALSVIWFVGMLGSAGDAFIHILFVVALIVLIMELPRGRRPIA